MPNIIKYKCKPCEESRQRQELQKREQAMTVKSKTPPHLGGHLNITHLDEGALDYFIKNFGVKSFLDIGCGPGGMLKLAKEKGLSVLGIDGDPAVEQSGTLLHDFTVGEVPINGDFDLAWSTEFLEHVDEKYQANYMAAFRHAKYVFVTAAPPGKNGHHHVNCRDREYWIAAFARYGFRFDTEATEVVKAASTMKREFVRNTGMFFVREKVPATIEPSQPVHSEAKSKGHIIHLGRSDRNDKCALEVEMVKRYCEAKGYEYRRGHVGSSIYDTAGAIKTAKMAIIWNGKHWSGPLIKSICEQRRIPYCFLEFGMLPQSQNWFVDPMGFCGDSVLNHDLSWVDGNDMLHLYDERFKLQAQYPLSDEGYVLVPMQIYNDSQVLHYTPFNTMEEFIEYVEMMYPQQRIVVRPHPRSAKKKFTCARAESVFKGDFFTAASKASVIVGLTSTCLYEAVILGKPVVALGDHPLRLRQGANADRVAAGALALRVPHEGGDIGVVLDRFGVRPL
jgi:SAM-dependent methyltransferase